MISDAELARYCAQQSIARARRIAKLDSSIMTRRCEYGDATSSAVTLRALVMSESGWNERYRTSVTLDGNLERHLISSAGTRSGACPTHPRP